MRKHLTKIENVLCYTKIYSHKRFIMVPTSTRTHKAPQLDDLPQPEGRAYLIDGNHIRANGRRLVTLALVGQVFALYWLISTPLALYWIQRPSVEGKAPLAFIWDAYVLGPTATHNLHGILLIAAFFVLLTSLRRLGISMRNDMPLGEETTRRIGALRWGVGTDLHSKSHLGHQLAQGSIRCPIWNHCLRLQG